jgi:DNA-binding HxlR family transcriptional regulator
MKSRPPFGLRAADQVGALGTISGKWKVRIVCFVLDGKRFGELRRMVPGVRRGTGSGDG